MDPNPLTIRELLIMAEAKEKGDWTRTSHLIAMVHNTQAGKDNQVEPNEFNPFARESSEELYYPPPEETEEIVKNMFGIK